MPGQIGESYIAGHSSNYAWEPGNYNHVFTQLGNLANDASFTITVTLNSGKQAVLDYVVTGRNQYAPTDISQFANGPTSTVAPVDLLAREYHAEAVGSVWNADADRTVKTMIYGFI